MAFGNHSRPGMSNSSSLLVPAAVASGVAIFALYRFGTPAKSGEKASPDAPLAPPPEAGTVSHIHLRVDDLTASVQFYRRLGLIDAANAVADGTGGSSEKYALLRCPGPDPSKTNAPYLLLEYSPDRVRRTGHAADAGIGRLCFLAKSAAAEATRMEGFGYRKLAEPVADKPGTDGRLADGTKTDPVVVSAVEDPDGNAVEFASMEGFTVSSCIVGLAGAVGVLAFPAWVHANVNATSYERSRKAYATLGFTEMETDYGRVVNTLYQSLGIPDPGVAKCVALIRTPKSRFCLDLIEWEEPRTGPLPEAASEPGAIAPAAVAVTVDDVAAELDRLCEGAASGGKEGEGGTGGGGHWTVASPLRTAELPMPLGSALCGTVLDPDGIAVELVSYPRALTGTKGAPGSSAPLSGEALRGITGAEKKKVVLVTGCDSGFGRSVACQAAALGFRVVAACYTEDGAEFLQSIAAATVVADLTTEDGLKRTIDTTVKTVAVEGHLWAVVNNAGTCQPGFVEWLPPSKFEEVMKLNFHAPVRLIHEMLPLLRSSGRGGRVINVTSVCGRVASPANSTYCASKFALEALSDSLRREMAPFGINVVVIEPMTMKTPLAMAWYDGMLANFRAADPAKTSAYSTPATEKTAKEGRQFLEHIAEDPVVTVGDMIRALVMKDPPTRIQSGAGAHDYIGVSLLPDEQADSIMQIDLTKD